jgi:hypothetical protein
MKTQSKIGLATLAMSGILVALVIPVSARFAHQAAAHPSARFILTGSNREMVRLGVYHYREFTKEQNVLPPKHDLVEHSIGEIILGRPQRLRVFGTTRCRGACAYGAGTKFGGHLWVGRNYAQLLKGKWYCSKQPRPSGNPLAPTSEVKSIAGTKVIGRSRIHGVPTWILRSRWGSRAGGRTGVAHLWISTADYKLLRLTDYDRDYGPSRGHLLLDDTGFRQYDLYGFGKVGRPIRLPRACQGQRSQRGTSR